MPDAELFKLSGHYQNYYDKKIPEVRGQMLIIAVRHQIRQPAIASRPPSDYRFPDTQGDQ